MQFNRKILFPLFTIILFGVLAYYWPQVMHRPNTNRIDSFESCANRYPVMESYPAQCNTPDGKHFVQSITSDERNKITLPRSKKPPTCGDGICQSVVCTSLGCPQPETYNNCPEDCKQ